VSEQQAASPRGDIEFHAERRYGGALSRPLLKAAKIVGRKICGTAIQAHCCNPESRPIVPVVSTVQTRPLAVCNLDEVVTYYTPCGTRTS
jgi:hypothetical protein